MLFSYRTNSTEWNIPTRNLSLLWRRYTEFEQLRQYLEVTYLWAIIPPLPEKRPMYTWQNTPTDTFDPDFVDRRRAGLEVIFVSMVYVYESKNFKAFVITALQIIVSEFFTQNCWSSHSFQRSTIPRVSPAGRGLAGIHQRNW